MFNKKLKAKIASLEIQLQNMTNEKDAYRKRYADVYALYYNAERKIANVNNFPPYYPSEVVRSVELESDPLIDRSNLGLDIVRVI